MKYGFYVDDKEIVTNLEDTVERETKEQTVTVLYTPKQLFNVFPVTRNSASLTG
jgi:hypothetical protein